VLIIAAICGDTIGAVVFLGHTLRRGGEIIAYHVLRLLTQMVHQSLCGVQLFITPSVFAAKRNQMAMQPAIIACRLADPNGTGVVFVSGFI
jgi:hypothetical protein